ncbi:MAG: diadenylate cyclase CdaA [Chloroflexota bacterium]
MEDILASLERLKDWQQLLDVAMVSFIIYTLLQLLRGTQAIQLMRGILLISLAIAAISQLAELTAFNWLLSNSAPVVLFAIPVIFQPELRRALERVGRTAPIFFRRRDSTNVQRVINEVVKAVEEMVERRHGALIVFEGGTGIGDIVESGTRLQAELSSELLTTIFFPNTALHDGAVIVRDDQVIAASCILPLTQRDLSSDPRTSSMGTRHRAAIGLTENSDALTVAVSEETGAISVARNGEITRLDTDSLREVLSEFYKPFWF